MVRKKWNRINRLLTIVIVLCMSLCVHVVVLADELPPVELTEGSKMDNIINEIRAEYSASMTRGELAALIRTKCGDDEKTIKDLQRNYTQENIGVWNGTMGDHYRAVDIALDTIKNGIPINKIPVGSFEDEQRLINKIVELQNAIYKSDATEQELTDLDDVLKEYRTTYGFPSENEDITFINMANAVREKLHEMNVTGPTTADDVDERKEEREEYKEQEKAKQHGMLGSMDASTTHTPDEIINEGNQFIEQASGTTIGGDNLQEASSSLYNILLSIGIFLAVAIGMYLGVKFMVSTAEDKAKVKEALIPYIAGCVVIFSAFIIWKFAILLLNGIA